MRRFGDLISDLGFNKEASLDSQKAFFRHLVRAANVTAPLPQNQDQNPAQRPVQTTPVVTGEQLSFDLEILGPSVQKKTGGR